MGWFHLKRLEMMRKALPKITMWQATIKRNKAQWRVSAALEGWRREVTGDPLLLLGWLVEFCFLAVLPYVVSYLRFRSWVKARGIVVFAGRHRKVVHRERQCLTGRHWMLTL